MECIRCTRRGFLGLSVMAVAGQFNMARAVSPLMVPVPPILMLHSRHRWLLPRLLDALIKEDYTGITFADLEAALDGAALPANPVIITIDDLCMVKGSPSFETFVAMKDSLVERDFKGAFSIVTIPDKPQNDTWWDDLAGWHEQGIELTTHTSNHLNLDDPTLTVDEFRDEISGSAAFIQDRTGQPVRALVTPFGSGYDRPNDVVTPPVAQACAAANIPFVVGIVEGREPISRPAADGVIYLGRVPPGVDNTVGGAMYEVRNWAV